MNVMHSLVLRQMRLQKRRTIITILGVIVSVAMIAAVSSFAASFMGLFQQVEIKSGGEWHAKISNTTAADRALIAQESTIQDVFVLGSHGTYELTARMGRYSQMEAYSLDAAGLDVMRILLSEGAYPQKEGEAAVTPAFAQATELKIGDTLQCKTETGEETLTVTGIASMEPLEGYTAGSAPLLLYQSAETRDQSDATAYIRFKHPTKALYDDLQALCERIPGIQEYQTHNSLLMYMGVSGNDVLMLTIYLMVGIIMAIILAAAVSLIYNAFAISVTDRAAQFGMLSSIGATMRQRSRAVLFEALVIGLIAIPFGLFFGYLGIGVTFSVVSDLLNSTLNLSVPAKLTLVVEPGAVALAVGLALLTVLISAWIPAKRAARVSPMEAIRKTQDIKLNGKAVKTSAVTRAIFGFEGELAAKNLKRNKKRYRVTTFSLAMSLILFLSAYSFTYYMTYSYNMEMESVPYSLAMSVSLNRDDSPERASLARPINYAALDEMEAAVLNAPYVTKGAAMTSSDSFASAMLPLEQFAQLPYTEQIKRAMARQVGAECSFSTQVNLIALDDASLAAYADQTGADLNALLDPQAPAGILVNGGTLHSDSPTEEVTILNMKKGDSLDFTLLHYPIVTESFQDDRQMNYYYATGDVVSVAADGTGHREITQDFSFRLAAVSEEAPFGMSTTIRGSEVKLILSERVFRAVFPHLRPQLQIVAVSENADKAEEALQGVMDQYATAMQAHTHGEVDAFREKDAYLTARLLNVDRNMREGQNLLTIINIFVYGFITLLSMVGAANIVGTISTSLMLRKREFAMVKSVGMGQKAFDKMIRCESVFYGFKAVIYGVLGSLLATFLMWQAIGRSFTIPFSIPWVQILLGVAVIFLLVAVTMAYSVHKIRRDSIVEDLRLE